MYMSPGCEDVLSLVVDIGSLTTRVGFAGDDGPKQLWNSCAGQDVLADAGSLVSSLPSAKDLIFPLNFYAKREHCAVKPCLFMNENGSHQMHEDVFEKIVAYTCEGGDYGKGRAASSTSNPSLETSEVLYKNMNHSNSVHLASSSCEEEGLDSGFSGIEEGMGEMSATTRMHRKSLVCGLGASLGEHPVLLSEPSKPSRSLRQAMTEVMFEKFDVPAVYVAQRALLSTFAIGRSTGLVVDMGAALLSIAPVTDGYVRLPYVKEYPVSGNTLDMQFSHFLAEKSIPLYPNYAVLKTFNEGVKDFCVKHVDCTRVHSSYLQYSQYETVRNLKEAMCRVAEDENDILHAQSEAVNTSKQSTLLTPFMSTQYNELPDGTQLEADPYMYKVPEILFKPSLIKSSNESLLRDFKGLPVAVAQCINECNAEIRKDLLSAIIFVGGTSKLTGLSERLGNTVSRLLSSKVRMVASSLTFDRRFSSWIGGSVLASMSSFHHMWISKEEYNEHGPRVVDRKCG